MWDDDDVGTSWPSPGDIVEARVQSVTQYGAWVTLDAHDDLKGLVLLPDIHWGRVQRVADHFEVGDHVRALVRAVDRARGQIALSTKHLLPDPWEVHSEHLVEGAVLPGRVAWLADYGLFLTVFEHVEGLVHADDLLPRVPTDFAPADAVVVRITHVERERRRLTFVLA